MDAVKFIKERSRMCKSFRLMKINMRLIAKFKTHLHKEYGDAIEDIAKMFDTLYAEQQKETPLMWYEYCYGVKDTGK